MPDIDVFISYKREERPLADQVARALKEAGYVAVTDLNIQKATDFGEAIDGMIRAAKVVVVLWTQASAASKWVRTEAVEGYALGKYLGVRVDPVSASDLPIEVRRNNWLDLSGAPLPQGLPALLSEVERLAGQTRRNASEAETAAQTAEKDLEFYQVVSEIGDIGGFRKYLKIYPNGAYIEDAQAKIDGIEAERDQEAFKDAKEMAAVGGYRKYLALFPNGAFAEDAKTFIGRNTGWRGLVRKVPVFGIVAAVGTAIGAYVTWQEFARSADGTSTGNQTTQALAGPVLTLEQNIERLERMVTNEKQENAKLQNELTALKSERSTSDADVNSLQKRLEDANRQLKEAEERNRKAETELVDVTSKLEATIAQNEAVRREFVNDDVSPIFGQEITSFPSSAEIKSLQTELQVLGFYFGAIDGVWGLASSNALKQAQRQLGVLTTGKPEDGLAYIDKLRDLPGSIDCNVRNGVFGHDLKREPSPFSPKIEDVPPGSSYKVLDQKEDSGTFWFKIQVGSRVGWIRDIGTLTATGEGCRR